MMPTAVFKTKRVVMLYVFILVALALNACSINKEKREIAYRQAETTHELEMPEGLEQPPKGRSLLVVPEELDKGEIPKNLELPPTVAGLDLTDDTEKSTAKSEDDETVAEKKTLQSEIIFNADNTELLRVKADIDTVWPRVAKAIKNMGFEIVDSNRGKFYYSISRTVERTPEIIDTSKPVDLDVKASKEEYFIYVEPGEKNAEITVRNAQGKIEGTSLANQLLLQIKGNIETLGDAEIGK